MIDWKRVRRLRIACKPWKEVAAIIGHTKPKELEDEFNARERRLARRYRAYAWPAVTKNPEHHDSWPDYSHMDFKIPSGPKVPVRITPED